jgi:hypothetical protein
VYAKIFTRLPFPFSLPFGFDHRTVHCLLSLTSHNKGRMMFVACKPESAFCLVLAPTSNLTGIAPESPICYPFSIRKDNAQHRPNQNIVADRVVWTCFFSLPVETETPYEILLHFDSVFYVDMVRAKIMCTYEGAQKARLKTPCWIIDQNPESPLIVVSGEANKST